MHTRVRIIAVCLSVVATLGSATGCAESDSDEPTAAVDVSKLESGNYPTTPRDIEKSRTPETGAILESIRLAEFVPLMMDLDNRLIFNRKSYNGHTFTAQHPPQKFTGISGGIEDYSSEVPGLITGWSTTGHRRKDSSLGLSIEYTILRFSNAAQAEHALTRAADKSEETYPAKGPAQIPGYPDARAEVTKYDAIESWLVRGEFLLWTYIGNGIATPPDPAPLIEFTKKIYDRQFELLKSYQPMPEDELSRLPADVDGLVARTLPSTDTGVADITGAYPIPAALHLASRPDIAKRAFVDAKVDLIANGDSTIYRSADAAAAARLTASLVDDLAGRYGPSETPPGLPDAKCFEKLASRASKSAGLVQFICYLSYERYVASVTAANQQDLDQKAGAQYKLLAHER